MPNSLIALPPGLFRNATEYAAGKARRYWDQSLTRWIGGVLAPIGGWTQRAADLVTGKARAILPWRDNTAARWIGIGTHLGLFVTDAAGTVTDVTPVGFTAGEADQSAALGYGIGPYGKGPYGTPRPDTGNTIDALVWDLDTFGQDLVGVAFSDGNVYSWDLDITHKAAALTGAPTSCTGLLVINSYLFALGAGGDGRKVQWCSQGDDTLWTPAADNLAGSIDLDTQGKIKRGVKVGADALILTDADAHLASYVNLPSIWRFDRVGDGCGTISKGAVITTGQLAAWWSAGGFFTFRGGVVDAIQCEVWSHLLQDLNTAQRSKITGFHNAKFGELWWLYPSSGSIDNDTAVVWNYRDNWWGLHAFARTCAYGPGVFVNPVACDSTGLVYEHETGTDFDGADCFAETGAMELGTLFDDGTNGDRLMNCGGIVFDEQTAGSVGVTAITRLLPMGTETTQTAATIDSFGRADQHWQARQAKFRFTGLTTSDWRVGAFRAELAVAGGR